eukprot:3824544-Alexandrium_andersonii.AAC.1
MPTSHALTWPRTWCAASAPAALVTTKPRRGDGPSPAMTATNPPSAARFAMVAVHPVLGLLALPRPAAPV